jgi:hypothetical protein
MGRGRLGWALNFLESFPMLSGGEWVGDKLMTKACEEERQLVIDENLCM